MHRRWFFSLMILGVVGIEFLSPGLFAAESPASDATEKYRLAYKFQLGEVLRYRVEHKADIHSTIEGVSQEAETKSESIKAWKVTDVLPSGELEFVHLVEVVRMSNRVPNRALTTYDSEQDQVAPPGFEQAARAVGVPLSVIRIKPTGEIVSREEKHPQPASSDDMPITLRLPEQPVMVGDEWDETFEVETAQKSGAAIRVRTRRVCKLAEVTRGIATIRVEYQILTPVSAFVESQLVERLSKGLVRFDLARGRMVSQELNVDRRILGFAGETSVMHYVSRVEERLLDKNERLARRP
jgi:hypothetical protein